MPVYKKLMGREEGMRLRRRLPQVRARVRLLRRGLRLGLVVVGGGRSRIRGCLSGIRVRRCSGGWWVWVRLAFEWCGDGDGVMMML